MTPRPPVIRGLEPPAVVKDPDERALQLGDLNRDFPGAHAWASTEGLIYVAVRTRGRRWSTGSTLVADNPAEMREILTARQRTARHRKPAGPIAPLTSVMLLGAVMATPRPRRLRLRARPAARHARRADVITADDAATVELFQQMNASRRLLRSVRGMALTPPIPVSVRSALLVLRAVTTRGNR